MSAIGAAVGRAARGLVEDAATVIGLLPGAARAFVRDRGIQWAAALAYYTLIGLVPLLIAVFATVKALGLHRGLTPFIVRTIGAGSAEVAIPIIQFIDQTNVRAAGALSVLGAVVAAFGILGNAELCFNRLWGRATGRPFWRKMRALTGVALATPVLLLLALGLTTALRRNTAVWAFFEQIYLGDLVLLVLRVVPYALLWVSFTLLYVILPIGRVPWRSAVAGAIVAGTVWQFAQWGYVAFVIRLVRYSAFYGALWQLPILLAWVYVGWTIVLFGAEVCRGHQAVLRGRPPPACSADDAGRTQGGDGVGLEPEQLL